MKSFKCTLVKILSVCSYIIIKHRKDSDLTQYELEGIRVGSESAKIDICRKSFRMYLIILISIKITGLDGPPTL